MRRKLAGALLVLPLVAPAVARADWGPPIALTPAGHDATVQGVAAGADDRPAVLVGTRRARGYTLALRRGDRHGRMGAPVPVVSTRNTIESGNLFTGRGDDLVAGWLEIVNGSRRPVVATGPRLQDRQVLAPGPRSTQIMRMAANRRGDAIVAFWSYASSEYSIYAAYRPAGERFGASRLVATGSVGDPAVAIGPDGASAVAWTERDGIHLAERPAGATTFHAPVSIPSPQRPTSDAAIAIDGGHVSVSWITGSISAERSVLVSERASANASFADPVTVSSPGIRIPHWITPTISLADDRTLVGWVEGVFHTTSKDRAALAIRSPGSRSWQAPIVRAARAPAHVYFVDLLGPAPGRPPLLALTTSRPPFRLGAVTATVTAAGGLAPSRTLPLGAEGGFRPRMTQGRRRTWLATERALGTRPNQHPQAVLFGSR